MKEVKVSVIVPVYNTEKYLDQCLESIVKQSLEDIEIIVINDGSVDKSHSICMKYYCKYPQKIKYIENINIGCSSTRNLGISLAKGEYIAFVDSDDYIAEEMYKEMYKKAKEEELDIVICGMEYIQIQENRKINLVPKNKKKNIEYLDYKNLMANPVNKLFKREVIIKNKIIFPVDIHAGEDIVFCFKAMLNSKKIASMDKIFYYYIQHGNNSIFNLDKRLGIFKAFLELYNYLEEKDYLKNKEIKKEFNRVFNFFAIKRVFVILADSNRVSEEKYNKYKKLYYMRLKRLPFLSLKAIFFIYYYKGIIYMIRMFNLYGLLKKLRNRRV